jgi:hypothetical protein
MEAKLDALLEQAGIAPSEIHRKLPAKYQPKGRREGRLAAKVPLPPTTRSGSHVPRVGIR